MSKHDGSRRLGEVMASFALSYGIGIFLIVALTYFGGIWNILANTRLLDPLIEGGVVRYHDGHLGVVDGVDDQESYLLAQDPIDYRLLLVAVVIYFFYWGFKGIKFHGVARFVGLKGSAGQHARAWLYGDGMGRFFPYRFGEASTASELEARGEDPAKVRKTFSVVEFLTIFFQIGLFWIFGLLVTNYAIWFAQTFWALVICAASYLFLRGTNLLPWGAEGPWKTLGKTYRALADRPATFAKLGFLAALVMLLDDLTPYVMAMAFTGDHVILNVPFFVIQSGVVAGYIARRFPLTPHGIGQWEWGFAMALYVSGVGFPEAATIALLDSAVRHVTGFIVFLVITLRYDVQTNFGRILRRYRGRTETAAPGSLPVTIDGGSA
ncbi:MAG: lysylphosphatidylglycerol synthase domain-containing protein [Planctomycetota bacterium]